MDRDPPAARANVGGGESRFSALWRRLSGERIRRWSPLVVLLAIAFLFRLPALLNAGAVNSDAAVVGLQAMHMLRGEWSPSLWGAAYQAPVDSLLAALMFTVLGPTPLALTLVPTLLQLGAVAFYFLIFRRMLSPWLSGWLTMPVVLTPMAINFCVLYVQRQACITLFVFTIFLLTSAQTAARPASRLMVAGLAAVLTLYLDLYAIQWIAPLVLFAVLCTWRQPWNGRAFLVRFGALAAGLLLGSTTVLGLRSFCPNPEGHVSASLEHLPHNARLLWDQALPWTLSYKIFAHQGTLYAEPFAVPSWFGAVQAIGPTIVLLAMVAGAGCFWIRSIPWTIRSLALFAMAVTGCSVSGFLVSSMPEDMWSTRYLAPLVLMMPFALGPIAIRLGTRWFALLCAPYLLAVTVNGWISYGIFFVHHGMPIVSARAVAREEMDVARQLRERNVGYAEAPYWIAYRLTFLFRENPVVVPLANGDDRYAPYRAGFDRAREVAYIFFPPSEPRVTPADTEARLRRSGARYERLQIADFTIFIEHRR